MRELGGDRSVCVVIPALNEGCTISTVVRGFMGTVNDCTLQVLVVDGHSSDNTIKSAEEAGATVIVQKGRGKGAAMIEAVGNNGSDVVIFIDGDGTYLPKEFESIVIPVLNGKADMVIGSRFKGKIEKNSIRPINFLGNKFCSFVTKIAFGKEISDIFSGYRAVRKDFFQKIDLRSCNFEIEAEMTVKALAGGFRVLETPVSYLRRRRDNTKLNPFKDGLNIIKTLLVEILRGRFS